MRISIYIGTEMKKYLIFVIVFFNILIHQVTISFAGYTMDAGLTGLYRLDDKDTVEVHGIVLDNNDKFIGTYINPFAPKYDPKTEALKDLLLAKVVLQESIKLSSEAGENYNIILNTNSDVAAWIETLNITATLLSFFDGYLGNPKDLTKYLIDNTLSVISIKAGCVPPQRLQTELEKDICATMAHPLFDYIKKVTYATVDKIWEKSHPEITTKVITQIFTGIDYGLQIGAIANNVIASFALQGAVIDKHDTALMIRDFTDAYISHNQDIIQLKNTLIKHAVRVGYMPYINQHDLDNFTGIFFHYIVLRKNYNFGNYVFTTQSYDYAITNSLINVDIESAPAAAEIMLEIIEQFGVGGNFKIEIHPKIGTYGKYYSVNSDTLNVSSLYAAVPPGNVMVSQAIGAKFPSMIIHGGIGLDVVTSIETNCEDITADFYTYNKAKVYFYGKIEERPMHKFAKLDLSCNYQFKNNRNTTLFTSNRSLQLLNVFLPEVFPDVPFQHWSAPYIGALVDQGLVKGDAYGHFNPKNNTTIGEFLGLVGVGIYQYVHNNSGYLSYIPYNIGNSWGHYVDFFNSRNVDIYPPNSSIDNAEELKSILNEPVTRQHVAKVLTNVLAAENHSVNTTDILRTCNSTGLDSNGWDDCSETLRGFGISRGSRKISNPQVFEFKPTAPITRDELVTMIFHTQEIAFKLNSIIFDKSYWRTY